jgi:hypothetical protein
MANSGRKKRSIAQARVSTYSKGGVVESTGLTLCFSGRFLGGHTVVAYATSSLHASLFGLQTKS